MRRGGSYRWLVGGSEEKGRKGLRLNAPRSSPTNRITSLRLIVVIRRFNCTGLSVGLEPERSRERNSRNSVPPVLFVRFVTAVPAP